MCVHEGGAVFLVGHLMNRDPKADLFSKIESQSSRRSCRRDDTLTSFCKVVSYLLKIDAGSATTSRTHREIIGLEQLPNQSPYRFKKHLWAKTSRCGCVYNQHRFINFFIEECNYKIRQQYLHNTFQTSQLCTQYRRLTRWHSLEPRWCQDRRY